jgi:hypothetical protein|tara:strand:+ start:664 stop:801 length:138 start_codon:yes stop_codon:yes gene_type:complete
MEELVTVSVENVHRINSAGGGGGIERGEEGGIVVEAQTFSKPMYA